MPEVVELTWADLGWSVFMMCGVVAVDRVLRLALGRDLVVGTFRVFVQLYLVGYVLRWVFAVNDPLVILAMLAVMGLIAGWHGAKRSGDPGARNAVFATGMVVLGTLVSVGFTLALIVDVHPWYNPQYLIPIAGMAMNGAMNGTALGISNLRAMVRDGTEGIECALALGAPWRRAVHPMVQDSIRRAMIPIVNAMMTAGIVQLPGMMTGQIIAGLSPTAAVRYQIMIFYVLAVSSTLAAMAAVVIYAGRFFTKAHQLRRDRIGA